MWSPLLGGVKALVFARERDSYLQLRDLCRADLAHDCAFSSITGSTGSWQRPADRAFRTGAESATDGQVSPDNNDISRTCDSRHQWLWAIAGHEVVETDRAHVTIAAAMLGKRVRYRPSSYHKVPAIAEYALEGFADRTCTSSGIGGEGLRPAHALPLRRVGRRAEVIDGAAAGPRQILSSAKDRFTSRETTARRLLLQLRNRW